MSIRMPIQIDLSRPKQSEETPYGQCDRCHYVGIEIANERTCPTCKAKMRDYTVWPDPELIELWHEEVAMWNQERVELAVVVAAMYFEASVFRMIYWGTVWLDPDLNWIGAEFNEIREKTERIWTFLNSIRSHKDTDAALKRLFGVSGQDMLKKVIGEKDAACFWENYRKLAAYRNKIIHCGKRAIYRAFGEPQVEESKAVEILNWCLCFIPTCWIVFSQLHNEYIHKPMWEKQQKETSDA